MEMRVISAFAAFGQCSLAIACLPCHMRAGFCRGFDAKMSRNRNVLLLFGANKLGYSASSIIKRAVKPLASGEGYKAPLAWQVCL